MLTAGRIVLGLVLIVFGVAKLFPIESFEFLLVDRKIAGWDGAPFLARFIVFWEILLGLWLLSNYAVKTASALTLGTLLVFTAYLVYDLFQFGNRADCGCSGQLIALSAGNAIIKNVFLMALAAWLLLKGKTHFPKRLRWLVVVLLIAIPAAITLSFAPIYEGYRPSEKVNEAIDLDMLPNEETTGLPIDYKHSEVIICFISPKCGHCKRAVQRLKIIASQHDLPPLYLVFYGKKPNVNDFMAEYALDFPYVIFPDDEFMRIIKGEMPTMYHINRGMLKQVWKGDMFEADELIRLSGSGK